MFRIPKRKKNHVMPGFDYMDVVGTIPGMESVESRLERRPRATQEAKAETRYPVKESALQAEHI